MGHRQVRDAEGFTDLERRFVLEYMVDFNGTAAYIRASGKKPSRKTAETNAWRLLQRPDIQALVKAERDRLMGNAELSVAQVLEKLRQFLMFDARQIFDDEGRLKPMKEWPNDVAAAVIGVKDTIAGREIKFTDKMSALEKAMKYHGLFERDNSQKKDPVAELLAALQERGSRLPIKP